MRLGLESPPPSLASTIRQSSVGLSQSSAFSPIDVDDDESTDDVEPQFPGVHEISALANRPSFLHHSSSANSITTGQLDQYESENRDECKRAWSEHQEDTEELKTRSVAPSAKLKPQLNFFFKAETQSMRIKSQSENSLSCDFQSIDEPRKVIFAARTSICGENFDRCELEFGADRVQLTIWKECKPRWKGDVKFAHMECFCFSQTDRPPYILLLQLDDAKGKSDFALFFDSIFAKKCENHEKKEQTISNMYGVVFFFDKEMDYMRCLSMVENNPNLACLVSKKLSKDQVQEYVSLDALQQPRSSESKRSLSPKPARKFATFVGNGAKQALGTVTSFFSSTVRTSVLEEEEENYSTIRENNSIASRIRTLDLSPSSAEWPLPSSGGTNNKQLKREARDAGRHEAKVIHPTTLRTVSEIKRAEMDTRTISKPQDEDASENSDSKKRAASDDPENGREKQRRIESRRHEELLEYPFDGSDTMGRISVTLGDVDRLQPGEFLNDNIIDFYLRFLWRHLEPLQQQQMYFFTSHFFSHLNGTNGATELSTADPNERFARVARWTQKETNLFDKRFLFIPINDSFHWSIAVFCNPGSAIIKKHRKVRRRSRQATERHLVDPTRVVDLVGGEEEGDDETSIEEDIEEEELQSCQADRLAYPPCLLFLDSLRCHRKKKFTQMLRNYLECEFKVRFASTCADSMLTQQNHTVAADTRIPEEEDTIITVFDAESICLVDPDIPLQKNNSDCGVFLLMYAASIVTLFPSGVTREDVESTLAPKFTASMFRDDHVLEFREYLQQLLFCLQFLAKHGLSEKNIIEEGLATFTLD